MVTDKTLVQKLVNSLLEKQEKRSWRKIAKEDYPPIVKPGTLCRIAKSKGKWMPKKSRKILDALGVLRKRVLPDYVSKFHHLPLDEKYKVYKDYIDYLERKKND